jgi:hypothetical protein
MADLSELFEVNRDWTAAMVAGDPQCLPGGRK